MPSTNHTSVALNCKFVPRVFHAFASQFLDRDVFIKNPNGTEYVGQVWPGYTVFPDWFANNTQRYWTEALRNWSNSGVEFSGIWLDMNEASSFCDGSWYVHAQRFWHISLTSVAVGRERTCRIPAFHSSYQVHLRIL